MGFTFGDRTHWKLSSWDRENNPLYVMWHGAGCGEWLSISSSFRIRDEAIGKYSFAVPIEDALRLIAKACPKGILEIGAGTGYWASLLRKIGADVVAYDTFEGKYRTPLAHGAHFPIVKGDHKDALEKEDHVRALFMSWPDMDTWALETLLLYKGDTVIYVGEMGGCTADDAFHEELEKNWDVESYSLPQWDGIHDNLYIYQRKRPNV